MEAQTVRFAAVRTTRMRSMEVRPRWAGPELPVVAPADDPADAVAPGRGRSGGRARVAAAVGVAVVGVASMSTAVFQTVVASSTSLPIHAPAGATAPPLPGDPVLAAPADRDAEER